MAETGLDATPVPGPAAMVPVEFPHRLVPVPWLVAEVPAAPDSADAGWPGTWLARQRGNHRCCRREVGVPLVARLLVRGIGGCDILPAEQPFQRDLK